jgi:hypothetical protein
LSYSPTLADIPIIPDADSTKPAQLTGGPVWGPGVSEARRVSSP